MHSDGLTKGSVDRQAIQDVMNGNVKYSQVAQIWKPKVIQGRPALEDAAGTGDVPPSSMPGSSGFVLRL